ncbi:MAG: NADH-quinone oxidoreductase subunit L [Planctomycetota bacterium]|jgi:NADH-quinone oxidoreductase subunit L
MTALLAWLTLLAPLVASVVLTVSPRLRRSRLGPQLAVASVLFCAATSLLFLLTGVKDQDTWAWMDFRGLGGPVIELGVLVDGLSKMMLLVVGWVGSAIFVFALGYMKGDPGIGRFFAKFALFVFSMLGIALSTNFLMIFIFWELVGASSYLLIGYYYDKPSAVEAGKKAFLVNRVADFGFLLGILLIWDYAGSFDFTEIEAAVLRGDLNGVGGAQLALASFLIFIGAAGKSAQVPFHVWLPDAMEGPTPVSALMHAATMVAAGVYMVVRVFFLFEPVAGGIDWGWAPGFVAVIGGVTAVLAATMALVQRDIKKVLAYSTLSQLGYMVMALGAGAYSIAMFHLTTHAFFKGLLFLCAGSVIIGCHHEQDMLAMGGLRKKMPITFWTFTAGMLALTGICPFAGFWSKDLILDSLHVKHLGALQFAATATAGLTALYMGRAWFLTFFGEYRGHAQPHESPKVMTYPLIFLALMSFWVGWLYGPFQSYLGHWTPHALKIDPSIAIVSTAVVLVGYGIAWWVYIQGGIARAEALKKRFAPIHKLLVNLYYFDQFYLWVVRVVQQGIATVCRLFEEWVIVKGLVGIPVRFTRWVADRSRRLQVGRLNFYAYCFLGGVTVLFFILVLWGAG